MTPKCLLWKTKTVRPSVTAHQQAGCYLAEHWVRSISQGAQWKRREVTKDQHCLLPNRVKDQPNLQDGVISLLQPTHTCSQDQRLSHPRLFPHIHINQSSRCVDSSWDSLTHHRLFHSTMVYCSLLRWPKPIWPFIAAKLSFWIWRTSNV